MLQDGNREWITTIACICADGTSLTPVLIYQAVSGRIQDTWLQDFGPAIHKAFLLPHLLDGQTTVLGSHGSNKSLIARQKQGINMNM